MASRRALHFVFKVGNRQKTMDFYRNVLKMKVLRHEEFEEGCKASCNGPYDGKWSKTMIGYGPEDNHFVVELTYNYGIKEYTMGNDFQGLFIDSQEIYDHVKGKGLPCSMNGDLMTLNAPDGHPFTFSNKVSDGKDPVTCVAIGVSNLAKSLAYWSGLLGMEVVEQTDTKADLRFGSNQCVLRLVQLSDPVDHATAQGRIAFACPSTELKPIEKDMMESKHTILTPYVSLDTPGKATVEVVILGDPDGHEICFVGDEGFRELSQVDPKAEQLLDEAMLNDKSEEWFAKKQAREQARLAKT